MMDNFIKMLSQKSALTLFLIAIGTTFIFPSAPVRGDRRGGIRKSSSSREDVIHNAFAALAFKKDIEKIRSLLKNTSDIHARNRLGESLLHVAVSCNCPEAIEFLLRQGIAVDIREKNHQKTPLHYAASKGLEECATKLIAEGANVDAQDYKGTTPLICAVKSDCYAMVLLLLDANASINLGKNIVETPLYVAVEENSIPILTLLLSRNAAVNAPDGIPSPLMLAAEKGRLEMVKKLIKKVQTYLQPIY